MSTPAEHDTHSPLEASPQPSSSDRTYRERASEELQREADQFRLLAQKVKDCAIFLMDSDGTVVSWNEGAKHLTGYTEEEIFGQPVSTFYPQEEIDAGRPEKALDTASREGQCTQEGWRIRKDGSRFWAHVTIMALAEEETQRQGFAILTRDLTWQKEREETLRRSEKRYRRLFETSQEGIAITTPEGWFTDVNSAGLEILGYGWHELREMKAKELYVDPSQYEVLQTQVVQEGAVRDAEVRLYRKDGEVITCQMSTTARRGPDGKIGAFHSVFRDVTEEKRTEERLRQSERRYRRLFETSQEGIVLASPSGEIIDANSALCQLTGYAPEELIGTQASALYDKQARQRLVNALQKERSVKGLELPLRRKDGTELICQVSATVWTNENGEAQAVQSFVRDITEEKRTQEALAESEKKFRALAENSTVGIFLIQEGGLQYVNEALAQMYGYAPEELLGSRYSEMLPHPHDRERVRSKIKRHLRGEEKRQTFRFKGQTKDGDTIHVKAFGARIEYQGEPALIGTDIDVTERTRLQREVLRIQEKERRRLGRDLHDVVASQLTGVSIMLDTVANRKVEDEQISERIQEIRDLVVESCEDIRHLSRGLNPAGLSEGDLPAILQRLASTTDGCHFEADNFEADDAVRNLESDMATHLYCIAQEATANARKYAEAEEIVIRLTDDDGARVLSIKDDGEGFDPDDLEEDSLGLRTMRYRAELLGADFSLDSTPGEGTHIRCRLPV